MNSCPNWFLKIHCHGKMKKEKRCPLKTWNYSSNDTNMIVKESGMYVSI